MWPKRPQGCGRKGHKDVAERPQGCGRKGHLNRGCGRKGHKDVAEKPSSWPPGMLPAADSRRGGHRPHLAGPDVAVRLSDDWVRGMVARRWRGATVEGSDGAGERRCVGATVEGSDGGGERLRRGATVWGSDGGGERRWRGATAQGVGPTGPRTWAGEALGWLRAPRWPTRCSELTPPRTGRQAAGSRLCPTR